MRFNRFNGDHMNKLIEKLRMKPGSKVSLAALDPAWTGQWHSRESCDEVVKQNIDRLFELQYLLFAENKHSILIVLQAMDSGGKDGTIRHVMRGLNPQGCRVTAFKEPSREEEHHDYLWRIHREIPAAGEIGIFNRSHYEDVLVPRVHKTITQQVCKQRYEQINAFEKMLTENSVTILKFYLHVSRDEQKQRLRKRLDDPKKNWKFSLTDIAERKYWDQYMEAYEHALTSCSTPWTPWFIIPSDKKWFRNFAVSQIIVDTMEQFHMKLPAPSFDPEKIKLD